ncbi:hypothetical protein SAMN04487917_1262, partial [Arthrobacter sp. yr096]
AEAVLETRGESREGEGARTSAAAGAAPALCSLICSMLTLCQQARSTIRPNHRYVENRLNVENQACFGTKCLLGSRPQG